MSILNNSFSVISHDPHPAAGASLVTILTAANAPGPYLTTTSSGTPNPGDIFPGAIVVMDANGEAILADNDAAITNAPAMFFVAVDGDQDLDGSFVHKVTCIQGGCELRLGVDNYVPGVYTVGQKLTCGDVGTASEGMFRVAAATEQIYGIVGQDGQNATNNTLHVILPQGISPAAI